MLPLIVSGRPFECHSAGMSEHHARSTRLEILATHDVVAVPLSISALQEIFLTHLCRLHTLHISLFTLRCVWGRGLCAYVSECVCMCVWRERGDRDRQRQTDKQTNRQTDKQTNRQTDK